MAVSYHVEQIDGLPVYSANQTRELDAIAIKQAGMLGFDLMSVAGRAAFRILRQQWPDSKSILVLCGGGNNGGDGYIVAGLAQMQGLKVVCCYLVEPDKLSGDAVTAYEWAKEKGVEPVLWQDESVALLGEADVVVDALLGTGLTGAVRKPFEQVIQALNGISNILSIDIPSGLSANTGQPLGCCVKAKVTVTFIGRKAGLYTGNGPEMVGKLFFADLNVPAWVYDFIEPVARLIAPQTVLSRLPPRSVCAHKGGCGKVLVLGGDEGMAGALVLASSAALRTGAGLVYGATRDAHACQLVSLRPEAMFRGVEDESRLHELMGLVDSASEDSISVGSTSVDSIVVGPGLGMQEWGQRMLDSVIKTAKRSPGKWSLVLDADALNLIARKGESDFAGGEVVMTPHPGEAARLLSCSVQEVEADRLQAAKQLSSTYNAVVVLKGAGTIVADSRKQEDGGVCWINTTGNPGMASAGMGDVLAGIIGALLASGMSARDAALCGVAMHGLSADLSVQNMGQASLLAGDVIDGLKQVWQQVDSRAVDWTIDE